ncbi:MAG: hypothetical protein J0M24_19080 [Verrucomicrobia bacterium]|nr:hypothetical protein [Verrucomicrobiota bacterium]
MRTILLLALTAAVSLVQADVIECDNGDRYNGKVLSMDDKVVTLQNDITGTLTIPRGRIVGIQLRPAAPKPAPRAATNGATLGTNKLQFDAAAIERIQNEYLATATPEANQLFQQMLSGVQSGQMNLGDVRNQAATTLKELRAAQKEFGDDALGGILETYGEVLESFLQQTAPGSRPQTPAARPQPRTAPGR